MIPRDIRAYLSRRPVDAYTAARSARYSPEVPAVCTPTARGEGASAVRSAYAGHPPEIEESFLAIVVARRVVVRWCFAPHAVLAVCELTRLRRGDSIIADHIDERSIGEANAGVG